MRRASARARSAGCRAEAASGRRTVTVRVPRSAPPQAGARDSVAAHLPLAGASTRAVQKYGGPP